MVENHITPVMIEEIWEDWLTEDGYLHDADFVDPNKVYYPLFGLGDEHSDVMTVGKSPALTVEQHADDTYERRSVAGPKKTDWPHSFEHYRQAWLGERIVDPQNKLIPVLRNLVTYIPEMSIEDLYFTNVYKDQFFDEDIDETTDGYNPKDLNNQARNIWPQYLPEEIEYVDPDLIVTFGKPATREIYQALGKNWNQKEDPPETGSILKTDKRKLLVFEHWDYYWREGSRYGKKDIRDEAHRTRFAEAYTTDIENLDT